jgi:hypothetical protein
MISLKDAQRLGLLPKDPKCEPAKKTRKHRSTWSRDKLEEWAGPDGWHVGIARMWRESGMVDMVVCWRDGRAGVQEVCEWEVFRTWSVEQVETKLREMERQG